MHPPQQKIVLPQKQIAAFKRRALATKDELLVALIGVQTRDEIVVEEIYYPQQTVRTPNECNWRLTDIVHLQMQVLPRQILGSLHSHPECAPHVSKEDIESACALGEIVFGVFSYWREPNSKRRRTSLDFYVGARRIDVR